MFAWSLTLTRSTGQAKTSWPAPPRQPARKTSKYQMIKMIVLVSMMIKSMMIKSMVIKIMMIKIMIKSMIKMLIHLSVWQWLTLLGQKISAQSINTKEHWRDSSIVNKDIASIEIVRPWKKCANKPTWVDRSSRHKRKGETPLQSWKQTGAAKKRNQSQNIALKSPSHSASNLKTSRRQQLRFVAAVCWIL